jgi:hypothetical protein
MAQIQETLTSDRNFADEAPTVVCNDCHAATPADSLIRVDPLHVQCPRCLYVFFLDVSVKKRE